MRFYFTLFLVLVVLFFTLRSCSSKLMGGAGSPAPAALVHAAPSPSPQVAPSLISTAIASEVVKTSSLAERLPASDRESVDSAPESISDVYRFKFRSVPAVADLTLNQSGVAVMVDALTNSCMIVGKPDPVHQLHAFLASIDVPLGSCAVRSWAVFVDKSVTHGFDLVAAISAVSGAAATSSLHAGDGALTLNLNVGDVAAALTAICDDSTVEVVQRPNVQLYQGVTSTIESIEEVPVPSTVVSQGIAQTSISYRKVGLQLSVIPTFFADSRLRLAVTQSNGLLGHSVQISGNEVPIIDSQSVSSTVELAIGQTVILGGVSTFRQKKVKGLLSSSVETSTGTLYVILTTYYDVPRAIPVGLPTSLTTSDLLSGVLPDRGWQDEERELIQSKTDK